MISTRNSSTDPLIQRGPHGTRLHQIFTDCTHYELGSSGKRGVIKYSNPDRVTVRTKQPC
jgi:hypothetical protein